MGQEKRIRSEDYAKCKFAGQLRGGKAGMFRSAEGAVCAFPAAL
jgi:hypothetical protein